MATVTFDNGIYIDGSYYHVGVIKCTRKFDFIWKYAERNQRGEHVGELLGIYFNYTLEFGSINNRDEYNRLLRKLTEKTEYHTVMMPGADGSSFTFRAYFASVSDEVKKSCKGKNIYGGLKVEFIAKEPSVS